MTTDPINSRARIDRRPSPPPDQGYPSCGGRHHSCEAMVCLKPRFAVSQMQKTTSFDQYKYIYLCSLSRLQVSCGRDNDVNNTVTDAVGVRQQKHRKVWHHHRMMEVSSQNRPYLPPLPLALRRTKANWNSCSKSLSNKRRSTLTCPGAQSVGSNQTRWTDLTL